MVKSNVDALGIIFPNSYDDLVPELVTDRLMASIPFASRYRMIDFLLSGMVSSGIDNISVIVRKNYHSLMDHLGSGRAWDLVRKNCGLNIVPPFAEKTVKIYNGRVEALASILDFLKSQKERYVVMADANIAANFDFAAFLEAHIESGADVTVAYTEQELPEAFVQAGTDVKSLYYTLDLEHGRVNNIKINSTASGIQNFSMNVYAISRETLIAQISQAFVRGYVFYERDILCPHLMTMNVQGYKVEGYCARITDMRSYYEENMKLLKDENVDALFSGSRIYTKIRDDNPTRYISGSRVDNVMAADGCIIEGEVENSVLFRGVKVEKGAKVKNCVLMQDTVIKAGANIEYVITDKDVVITENRELKGTDTFQVFVEKAKTV